MSTFKSLSLLLSLLILNLSATAFKDVSLQILYNGQAVKGHYIELKNGDITIGRGTTNLEGKVTINANLLSKNIDIYGEIIHDKTKKTWQLIGYITLDNNFAEIIDLHKYTKEIAKDSDGLLSEKEIALSWGLTETNTIIQKDPIREQSELTPIKLSSSEEKGYKSEEKEDEYKVVYGSTKTYRDAMEEKKSKNEKKSNSEKTEIKKAVHSIEKASLQQKINLQEFQLNKKKENIAKKKDKGLLTEAQEKIKFAEINILELKIQENYAKLERMD